MDPQVSLPESQQVKEEIQSLSPVFTEVDLASPTTTKMSLVAFTFKDFFGWWYVQMPLLYLKLLARIAQVANDQLSITLLLTNFFSPWRKDNSAVGWFMGIAMKIIYLPIAIAIFIAILTASIIFILFWVLIPITTLIFIFLSPFI